MGDIVVDRDRIDDAAPCKGQPLLLLEIRDLLGQAVTEPMIGTIGKPTVEQARDIARCHRAIGNAAPLGCNLDQRLEIEKAPRSGPNDRHVDAAPLGFGGDGPPHGRRRPKGPRHPAARNRCASWPALRGKAFDQRIEARRADAAMELLVDHDGR